MVDYNDGKWHGWNGGECPVHPKSVVQIVTLPPRGGSDDDEAGQFVWDRPDHLGNPIVAFRVIKTYREPREWFAVVDKRGRIIETSDDVTELDEKGECIVVREVQQ